MVQVLKKSVDFVSVHKRIIMILGLFLLTFVVVPVFGNKTVKVISGDASDPILYMYGIDRNIPIIDTLRDRVKIARKESGIFEVANRS